MRDEHLDANAGPMCFATTRYEHAIKFLRGSEDEACTSYHVVFGPALQSGAIFTDVEAADEVYKDREDNRIEIGIATIKDADRILQILISCARSHMPRAVESVTQAAPLAPQAQEDIPAARVKQYSAFDNDLPDAKALWEKERGNWEEGRQLREKGTMSNLGGVYVRKVNKWCNSKELFGWTAPGESAAKRVKVEDSGREYATNGDAGAISCP